MYNVRQGSLKTQRELLHKEPTAIQRLILQYFHGLAIKGIVPTYDEARKDLGYKSVSSLQRGLELLEKKGLMVRRKHARRGWTLTLDGHSVLGVFNQFRSQSTT